MKKNTGISKCSAQIWQTQLTDNGKTNLSLN